MKPWKRMGIAGMGLLLAAGIVFPVYGTNQEIDAAKKEASALEEEKKKTEQILSGLEGQKHDVAEYIRQLDVNLEELEKEQEVLNGQIQLKEEEIAATQIQLEEAKQTEEKQYASMKLRIKYMYEKGDTSFLDLLIESKDFAQLLNRAEYISKISEYDRKQLDVYQATKQAIAQQEEVLENERQELMAFQASVQAKQASVELLLQAKQEELVRYEGKIASAQDQIAEYQKNIAAQEEKIRQLEEEIKRKEEEARRREEEERKKAQAQGNSYTTADLGNIKFIWPCPSSARITSGFGNRTSPMEGASANHQGIDIGASTGSSIVAAAKGVVSIAAYSYSAGNYVMISHGGGIFTVYMHCSKLDVSAGQTVEQGQVIGAVGSTGFSTGPHLHFGIRSGGVYVNPSFYVSP
ncbi:MAG: peptidoglycan DD-metalloendopeptidase family protein [Lachnospiraceae bacterium]|jgi:murein DD-endopeptidase MepM/ murein hydrolase activator NlpD|nr:peptidoglycan DD-metalloendopeptidase family protein [Lachnospiraceae bacterium]